MSTIITQHSKYGLIDIIENSDCLEIRQLSEHGARDIVLVLSENRKAVALAICPELSPEQKPFGYLLNGSFLLASDIIGKTITPELDTVVKLYASLEPKENGK